MKTITLSRKNKEDDEPQMPPMLIPEQDVGNRHHSLFKEEVDEKVSVEVVSYTPGYVNYVAYIGEFSEMTNGLHKFYNELRQADDEKDHIELRISSHGGFVTEGAQFYNIIREKFEGRCTTYLDAHGYSMGALLFCIGDKERVIYETSSLMFHDFSSGAIGKANEIISSIQFSAKHIRNFFKTVIVTPGYLTEAEFEQMTNGKDFWMDAKELCERKIATHVMVGKEKYTTEEYLAKLAGKPIKKAAAKKQKGSPEETAAKALEEMSDEQLQELLQNVSKLGESAQTTPAKRGRKPKQK